MHSARDNHVINVSDVFEHVVKYDYTKLLSIHEGVGEEAMPYR